MISLMMALSRIVRLLWSSQTIEKVTSMSTTEESDSPSVKTHCWRVECYICARHKDHAHSVMVHEGREGAEANPTRTID
jgi:hypothetical protein